MDRYLSLGDLQAAARRRLPRAIYGFVRGAAEDEWTYHANRSAFSAYAFRPRVLVDVSQRDLSVELLGRTYAMPVGIAPMGSCCLSWIDGDLAMARAAAAAGVPYILSAASSVPLERIVNAAPHAWYQAYVPPIKELIDRLLTRVEQSGYEALVLTLDTQIGGNREINIRNGFTTPLRPSLRLFIDGMVHPRWVFGTLVRTLLARGVPHYENLGPERGGNLLARTDNSAGTKRPLSALAWSDVEWIRDRWKGRLVLKSILHEADAARAKSIGVDGIIVSNHGGRQLDGALPALLALPSIIRAAGDVVVMIDSGFRRGTDVLKALALGARMVFMGRPMLFGLAVGGEAGVARALDIVRTEIDRDLALLGCGRLSDVARELLCEVAAMERVG